MQHHQPKQASQSIRGAITNTGQFLQNATQKIVGSKSAQTMVMNTMVIAVLLSLWLIWI